MGEEKSLIGDLAGISEPLKKLIETIESGIGRVFKATFAKKDADAKAYEIRALAAAKADAIKLLSDGIKAAAPGTGGLSMNEDGMSMASLPAHEQDRLPNLPILSLEGRAQDRQAFQESIRQQNIESITAVAAEQLEDESAVESDPVDPDWTTRFFRYAEDISNEQMQNIWGRILAGEVKKPGSYSYRTLEIIRNLAKIEAETFVAIADRIVKAGSDYYFLVFPGQFEPSVAQKLILIEAGLISSTDTLVLSLQNDSSADTTFLPLESGTYYFEIYTPPGSPSVNQPVIVLTEAGKQVYNLVAPDANIEYLKLVVEKFINSGRRVDFGKIIKRHPDGRVQHFDTQQRW